MARYIPLRLILSQLLALLDSIMATPVPEGTKLTLTLPDDFHHHFRDGIVVENVLEHATQQFGRAIAMPNLKVSFIF